MKWRYSCTHTSSGASSPPLSSIARLAQRVHHLLGYRTGCRLAARRGRVHALLGRLSIRVLLLLALFDPAGFLLNTSLSSHTGTRTRHVEKPDQGGSGDRCATSAPGLPGVQWIAGRPFPPEPRRRRRLVSPPMRGPHLRDATTATELQQQPVPWAADVEDDDGVAFDAKAEIATILLMTCSFTIRELDEQHCRPQCVCSSSISGEGECRFYPLPL